MRLSIGQVSEYFKISKDTLRYYDKIGILKPEVNEDNGYRFYEAMHLERLGFILNAKYLGVSLNEIKKMIDSENIYSYLEILVTQEQMMHKKIEALRKMEFYIKESKAWIEKIVSFENEYDFSKLPVFEEHMVVYGFNIKPIADTSFYEKYIDTFEQETVVVENERPLYIYYIRENQIVEEDKEMVYMKGNTLIHKVLMEIDEVSGATVIQKKIQGDMVHARFYGSMEEIQAYILSLNQYFSCPPNHPIYVYFDFYLPNRTEQTCYFVEIQLEI